MSKLFLLISLSICSSITAQTNGFTVNYINPKTSQPGLITFDSQSQNRPSFENASSWFVDNLNANQNFQLKYKSTFKDQFGMSHLKYAQYFKNYKVESGEVIIHAKGSDITSLNGRYFPQLDIPTNLNITSDEALNIALKLYPEAVFMWEVGYEERLLKLQTGKSNSSYRPVPELLIMALKDSGRNSDFRLAYKIDVYVHTPHSREWIYIDAETGEVLSRTEQICTIDKVGIAHTKYSGIRSINCDSIGTDSFILNDLTRGNGILTIDARVISVDDSTRNFLDTDNVWNNVNQYKDEVATDVHWGTATTYDFYFNKFGRNGYDDSGTKVISKVHVRKNYNNAYWNGTMAHYGDGDGVKFTPLTSLDICAHELSHGVTGKSAGLIYKNESGALNESFSDIFAKCVQHDADSAGLTWLIADQIVIGTGKPFRSLSNPKLYNNPRYYYGQYFYTGSGDNGGVHINSGVQNYWFYLLTQGGSGVRELDQKPFNVTGIGMHKGGMIAYQNLTAYLNSFSEYVDACYLSIDAAKQIFGNNSDEVRQVQNAWYAVGLFDFTDIEDKNAFSNRWTVSPNPGSTLIKVSNPYDYETYDLEIIDMTGKSVLGTKTSTNENIDVSALETGVYFIRINGSVLKWVKQN